MSMNKTLQEDSTQLFQDLKWLYNSENALYSIKYDGEGNSIDKINLHLPETREQAHTNAYLWGETINLINREGRGLFDTIAFQHQKKDAEVPLNRWGLLAQSVGYDVERKYEEGEIENVQIQNISLVNVIDGAKAQIVLPLDKEEYWREVSKIAGGSQTFNTSYVYGFLNPHRVFVPLNDIYEITLKK